MPRPLPERRNIANPFAGATNLGLVWSKFFDRWTNNHAESPGGPEKQRWIGTFCRKLGDEGALAAICARQKNLARALGGTTEAFTTTTTFVTGTGLEHPVENGFLWHHTLGVPFLPGSSVKGLIRAWAEHWQGVEAGEIHRVFGSPADDGGVGSVIVFDALPIAPLSLMAEVLTPHDGGWRQSNAKAPSDWQKPVPIPFLAVAPGARFLFAVAPRPGSETGPEDVKTAFTWLKQALDWTGAGARTAVGFGRFLDDTALDNRSREDGKTALADRNRREQEAHNAPPRPGETMRHDEWGRVVVRAVNEGMAVVYSLDEAEEVELPISQLTRP